MTNYKNVLSEVRSISSQVTLVAVSKTHDYSLVMDAYNEGARIFGENRVQEIEKKFPLINERPDGMKVFLIGHLQKNKVKKAVSLVDRIESVDSIELLNKINDEAKKINKVLDILLEFNSSLDENKTGFKSVEEIKVASLIAYNSSNINLMGVMTIGPLEGGREENIKAFRKTKEVYDTINNGTLNVLSMGMSQDWHEAIECGSTEIRIGRAIFGERVYKNSLQ